MPYRAANVLLAALGCVAVIALLLLGADALRASESGPKWKRRLLGAGLVLMAALGISSCSRADAPGPQPLQAAGPAAPSAASLEDTPEWKTIVETWRYVMPFAESGRSTDDERRAIRAKADAARAAVEKLTATGLLSEPEGKLLISETATLFNRADRYPPLGVDCYKRMTLYAEGDSVNRLVGRLAMLKEVAARGVVHRGVLDTMLVAFEADMKRLADPKILAAMPQPEHDRAATVLKDIEAELRSLKEMAGKPKEEAPGAKAAASLEETPEWKALSAAWAEAAEVGSGKRGDYPFDEAGKKKLLDSLAKADADLGKLQAARLLGEAEVTFLKSELKLLVVGVQMKRPTEMRNATCYEPMAMPSPQKDALNRIEERLPLVQKMAESKALSPEVAAKVGLTMLRDIETATKKDPEHPLTEAEQARAAQLTRDATEAVRKIYPQPFEIMCYKVMMAPERSMRDAGDLALQLALVERMEAAGTLSPSAAEKVRERIAEDLGRAELERA